MCMSFASLFFFKVQNDIVGSPDEIVRDLLRIRLNRKTQHHLPEGQGAGYQALDPRDDAGALPGQAASWHLL